MTLGAYISHKMTQETFMGGEKEERKEEIIKKRQNERRKGRGAKGWRVGGREGRKEKKVRK